MQEPSGSVYVWRWDVVWLWQYAFPVKCSPNGRFWDIHSKSLGDFVKSGTTLPSGNGDDPTNRSGIQLAWSTWTLFHHNTASLLESFDDISHSLSTQTKRPGYLG
jgi:hypothetical protein